jgi:hypothetical protein
MIWPILAQHASRECKNPFRYVKTLARPKGLGSKRNPAFQPRDTRSIVAESEGIQISVGTQSCPALMGGLGATVPSFCVTVSVSR